LTTSKGSTITSSTWETFTTLGVVTHKETGYLNDGTVTRNWEYNFDAGWHLVDDTWTNSKDGSIVSQKTLIDSQGIVTYLQNGHNSANTSSWEYHFDASWHLIDGTAVDGILTTTFGTNFTIFSQTGDISKMTDILINGVSCFETIAIDAASGKKIETLYSSKGDLIGYRMNDDKIIGSKFLPGTITFDTTWKNILNKTWTNSDGTTVSEDNITDTKGIVTHVQKGHDSTGTNTWEYHFDAKWILIDGWSSDGLIKTTYGADFIKINTIADTSKLTPVTDNLGVVTAYEMVDNASTMSSFDKAGVPTGHRTLSTTVDSKGILSTTMTNFDADWKMLGSSWTRSDGTSGITDVTHNPDGKVLVTTETGHKADSTGTMNWVYHFDADWHFLGGTIYNGVTKTMKAFAPDWTEMTPLKNDPAHPDLVTGYKWTNAADTQHTTTYYDLDAFHATGYSQPYAATELVGEITAGTRTYNADWTHVLDNIQLKKADGSIVSQDTHYGSDGKTITGYEQIGHSTFDYHFDANWVLLSGTIIDGIITTKIDSTGTHWTTDTSKMTAIKDIYDHVIEYQKTDPLTHTTIHSDSNGLLTGYSEISGTVTKDGNTTSYITNYANDHTNPTGFEQFSHNSDSSSYWDVILDAKGGYEGKWLDDGLKTTAYDQHDVLLQTVLDAGHPEAVHLAAVSIIGLAAVTHDQVI